MTLHPTHGSRFKTMKATLVIIGDEILLGRVIDTNSGHITRALDAIGIETTGIMTVGDKGDAIRDAVITALDNSNVVITTGGLGPTKDDITKHVLAGIFGGEIVRDDSVTANINEIFERRGLKLNRLTLDQALVPSSARILQNRYGTAPVMVFEKNGKSLIALPGVPVEMEGMLPDVVRMLLERYHPESCLYHATIMLYGISESALAQHLDSFEKELPPSCKLAYLPDSPVIKLRLDSIGHKDLFEQALKRLKDELHAIKEINIISEEDLTVPEIVLNALRNKGLSLGTAESCTGGNIAHIVTSIPGASDVFYGGVVSYANAVKTNILGVNPATLENFGAVSRETVTAMAEGACQALGTDCAVATSGIAGPGGATPDKPVGTVWIAVKTPAGTQTFLHRFPGDRNAVIRRASTVALIHLIEAL